MPNKRNISSIDVLSSKITGNPKYGKPSRQASHELVESVISVIREKLNDGKSVTLPGVGKLKVVTVKNRVGRNPKTGEVIEIPSKRRIRFSLSSKLRKIMD